MDCIEPISLVILTGYEALFLAGCGWGRIPAGGSEEREFLSASVNFLTTSVSIPILNVTSS